MSIWKVRLMKKRSIAKIVNDCFDVTPAKLAAWNLIGEGYSEENVLHEMSLPGPIRVAVANSIRDLLFKMKSDPEYTLKVPGVTNNIVKVSVV